MSHAHFSPHLPVPLPCWHCRHYESLIHGGSAALCTMPRGPRVRSSPRTGCSAFEREVGADDEPGPPASAALPAAWAGGR